MLTTIIIIALLVDLAVFANDKYFVSCILLAAEVGLAWYFVPELAVFISSYGWLSLTLWYVGIGIAVAAVKWLLFNFGIVRKLRKLSRSFVYRSEDTASKSAQFLTYITLEHGSVRAFLKGSESRYYDDQCSSEKMTELLTPVASEYIDRIGSWIFQWPIVLVSFLLEYVVLRIAELASDVFGAVFGKLSKYLISEATRGI